MFIHCQSHAQPLLGWFCVVCFRHVRLLSTNCLSIWLFSEIVLYYGYAEKKLGKLEGSNKRKLTSRDVISSLSEAREDHMKQLMSNTGPATTSASESHLYDPWKPHTSTSSSTHVNTPQLFEQEEDRLEGHVHFDNSQQSPRNRGWKRFCCCCWSPQAVAYSRANQRITSADEALTSLTPEEESAFLLDCDELGLTWEKSGEDR